MTANQVLLGVGLILLLPSLGLTAVLVLITRPLVALLTTLRTDMTTGFDEQRERIKEADLELASGELLAAATGRGAQLQGITAVLLLTSEDDFNALGSMVLAGSIEGPVYRLAARLPSHGVVAPYTGGEILFEPQLTRYEVSQRYAGGARIRTRPADGGDARADGTLLFLVRADGRPAPVTRNGPPEPRPGDTMVLLGPTAGRS